MSSFRFSPRPNRAQLIHWREWGQSAFDEAIEQDKLIALCIVAFWCGVCQRLDETTFSSEEVQLLLNAYFVPIRVEENQRPDVDLRYAGEGWPTIVFMTPHGEPVLTVNALESEQLISVLVRLVDAHDQHRAEPLPPPEPEPHAQPPVALLSQTTVTEIVGLLEGLADRRDGGFGGPHKYFYTDALRFYLRLAQREPRFLDHVDFTLQTLVERSIYDARDGGFFRYSSKPDWNEPHPEKLLIDQADLLRVYLEAFELTYDVAHQRTAEQLITYMDETLGMSSGPFLAGCQDFVRSESGELTPVVDSLVYCDANAHTISAYLHAWTVLERTDCRDRALQLLDAVWETFKVETGGVQHYFDGTRAHVPGLLKDSVALGRALLDGYSALKEERYLQRATLLAEQILRMHRNPEGGFFDISEPGPAALQRPVTELTQNAAAAMFFLGMGMRDAAHWALLGYSGSAHVYGAYAASFGHALDLYLA